MEGLKLRKIYFNRETEEVAEEHPKLWLGEELLLLALNDNTGSCSLLNSTISAALRGSVLIELWLAGRIVLAESLKLPPRKRAVLVKSGDLLGQGVLDEALACIGASSSRYTVSSWLNFFNGESWNPFFMTYQLKNVREKLAKDLVEKGVLRNDRQSFWLFSLPSHPLADVEAKRRVIKKVQEGLLAGWNSELQRFDPRLLSLIVLARAGEVMESALDSLSEEDRDIASRRLHFLDNVNFDSLAEKSNQLHWTVFHAFFG